MNEACQCHELYGGSPCRSVATKDDGLCDFCRRAHDGQEAL